MPDSTPQPAATPEAATCPPLYPVGYGARTLDAFLQVLHDQRLESLISQPTNTKE